MTPARTLPLRALARLARAAAALLALAPTALHAGPATLPTDFADTSIVQGLDLPTGVAEVPDPATRASRRILFVEQYTARVGVVVDTTAYTVGTVPGVSTTDPERGLLGIAVDPGWPARPYIYIHCSDNRAGEHMTVSRFTLTGDLGGTGNGQLQFDPATRYDLRADFPDNAGNHNGGSVRFGPDGRLYVSLGDDATFCSAQDLTIAVGKILRLDVSRLPATAGGPAPYALLAPADNPFASNADSIAKLVYAEGLRNPFRIHLDPATGAIVIGDVGQSAWEEVDLADAGGMDFGWPMLEGPAPYGTCTLTLPAPLTAPIADYPHPDGAAVMGGPRYRRPATATPRFPPEYDGDIFYSDYYSGFMRRIKLANGTWSPAPAPGQPNATDWGAGFDYVSDVIECSDGSLVYCRQLQAGAPPGELRRITYVGSAGAPPAPAPGLALDPPRPNPSRGDVTIAWTQPAPGPVTLTVHDAGGRRVRTLLALVADAAGPHQVAWDGRDDGGRALRAGLYFVRLETGGETRRGRLTLLR